MTRLAPCAAGEHVNESVGFGLIDGVSDARCSLGVCTMHSAWSPTMSSCPCCGVDQCVTITWSEMRTSRRGVDVLMTLRWVIAMKPPRARGIARVGDSREAAFRVLPSDLDLLMHMTNGRYLSVLDAARIAYMADTGLWRAMRARRWHPVVVAQTITYRRPLTLGTRYHVRTAMIGVDARNVYYQQEFHVGATTHAVAVVAVRHLDRSGGSILPEQLLALDVDVDLPQALPEWVTRWSEASRTHSGAEKPITDSAGGIHA